MQETFRRLITHFRICRNCDERFATYSRYDKYCDNCCYMETVQDWKERAEEQIEELIIA